LNKDGKCVLPHNIPEFADYDRLMTSIEYCEQNKTHLRYFDLTEIIRYLTEIHRRPHLLAERYHMDNYFTDISEITMNSLKLYYLATFRHINRQQWPHIHASLLEVQTTKFPPIVLPSQIKGGGGIHRTQSVQTPPTKHTEAIAKVHSFSVPIDPLSNHTRCQPAQAPESC
jgi:hypothetical protein